MKKDIVRSKAAYLKLKKEKLSGKKNNATKRQTRVAWAKV